MYKLTNYKPEHIINAKKYLKKAFYGSLEICLDARIDSWIEQLSEVSFSDGDEFTFMLELKTVGTDLLAAIGCSIIDERNKNKE